MSLVSRSDLETAGFCDHEAARRYALFEQVSQGWSGLATGRRPDAAYHVPGRIEVLGKHTDYAGGRSLVAATEQGFAVLAASRSDQTIRILDQARGEVRTFQIAPDVVAPRGDWANYPITVARRLATDFGASRGIDLVFRSDLPYAAGVSSSSALVVALALALIDANHLADHPRYRSVILTPRSLGGYLGAVENGKPFGPLGGSAGVGTMGGSQDQTAILCSKPDALVQYRFDPVREERTIPWPPHYRFAIGASGVIAEKAGAAIEHYNGLARLTAALGSLAATVSYGQHPTLGSALIDWIDGPAQIADKLRSQNTAGREALEARLTQLTAECRTIIPGVAAALERSDYATLGALVESSQRAAEMGLKNQIPETIALVDLARGLGAVAASAFGAGFGGSVWAMIDTASADRFISLWRERYLATFPNRAGATQMMVTRPSLPATRLPILDRTTTVG